jgi:spermidine synthase
MNYATGCALLAVVVLFPSGLMREHYVTYPIQRFLPAWTPIEGREGLNETIIYLREEAFGEPVAHRMLTNSHSMSSTVTRDARYMKLFVYWPVAVHPAPRSALLIGYGVGVTAKALTDTAALETIDVIDTSRDILEMNRHVYPDPADYPLNDPRVKIHIEDGRYFLQTTDRRFDIITGEPPPPNLAGVVSLYSAEYFALVRDRLNEGGIATYWLPVHNLSQRDSKVISRAFCSVFDDCTLWTGAGLDWMLVGTRNATGPVSAEHFARQWEDPIVGPEIRALGFESPEQLGALFMGGREFLLSISEGVEPLTDRYPKRLSETLVVSKEQFLPWMNTNDARRRFEQDPLVTRLWPPSMRRAALAHFSGQKAYNRILNFIVDPMDHLPEIHRWITTTSLETAPLWYLGSDSNHQRAAARAWAAGRSSPAIHFHLGASALVRREFAEAVTHFQFAGEGDPHAELSRLLEVYALGLDKRCEQAEALAEKRGLGRGQSEHDKRSSALLGEVCPRQQVGSR